MLHTIRIIVHGRVQGVYYRQSTKEKATALGITGTVQNNPDGSVTIIASGHNSSLNQLKEWYGKGPSRAIVTGIDISPLAFTTFESFSVIR